MKTDIAGNGYFTPDEYDDTFSHCDICQEPMSVRKDTYGPTGMAEAMANRGHVHVVVTCPFRYDKWHIQAYKLRQEARDTVSKRIEDMLLEEMDEVVKNRRHTK